MKSPCFEWKQLLILKKVFRNAPKYRITCGVHQNQIALISMTGSKCLGDVPGFSNSLGFFSFVIMAFTPKPGYQLQACRDATRTPGAFGGELQGK